MKSGLVVFALAICALLLSGCITTVADVEQEVRETPWWFLEAEFSTRVTYVAPASSANELEDGTKSRPILGLQRAVEIAKHGDLLLLQEGTYDLIPQAYVERRVGNAADADYRAEIPVSVGLLIEGKALSIIGSGAAKTIIKTNANYGVLFENAGRSQLKNLTLTGGARGKDGRSTDAALVVRYSWLAVEDCNIVDNNRAEEGAPTYPGVIGVCGREGSALMVRRCTIRGNTWDGVALYRSDPEVRESQARALIEDCDISQGNGVGVGVTWDAFAMVVRTKVHNYWKGIGAFGNSVLRVYNSSVFNQRGWGIVVTGDAYMEASNNVIFSNGTTGMAAWSSNARGVFRNNIIANNGVAEDEWVGKKTGLWLNSEKVQVIANCFWANKNAAISRGGVPKGDEGELLSVADYRGCVEVDPLFVDAAKGNFALKKESPLIGKGDDGVRFATKTPVDIGLTTPIRFEAAGVWGAPSRSERWFKLAQTEDD